MNNSFRFTLFSLAGLLCGVLGGVALKNRVAAERASGRAKVRHIAAAADIFSSRESPAIQFDRLQSQQSRSMEAKVKMQQLILEMPPEEARGRMHMLTGSGREWLTELLVFRAAANDPEGVLNELLAPGRNHGRPGFVGLFRSWVAKDPETAMAKAEAADRDLLPFCTWAWAELDPSACARALPGRIVDEATVLQLTGAWVSLDPQAAHAWVSVLPDNPWWQTIAEAQPLQGYLQKDQTVQEKAEAFRDNIMNDFLWRWVAADPVSGFQAAAATNWGKPFSREGDDPSIPYNRPDDWIMNAFNTFNAYSPELAAQALAALPAERFSTPGLPHMLRSLEEREPGTGMRFALTLPEGNLRDQSVSECLWGATDLDFELAKRKVNEMTSGMARANAAAGVLRVRTFFDPYGARKWLMELQPTMTEEEFRIPAHRFSEETAQFAPALAVPWQ